MRKLAMAVFVLLAVTMVACENPMEPVPQPDPVLVSLRADVIFWNASVGDLGFWGVTSYITGRSSVTMRDTTGVTTIGGVRVTRQGFPQVIEMGVLSPTNQPYVVIHELYRVELTAPGPAKIFYRHSLSAVARDSTLLNVSAPKG
jgi:hypothetical protein